MKELEKLDIHDIQSEVMRLGYGDREAIAYVNAQYHQKINDLVEAVQELQEGLISLEETVDIIDRRTPRKAEEPSCGHGDVNLDHTTGKCRKCQGETSWTVSQLREILITKEPAGGRQYDEYRAAVRNFIDFLESQAK